MASVSAAEPLPLSLKPTDAAELTPRTWYACSVDSPQSPMSA